MERETQLEDPGGRPVGVFVSPPRFAAPYHPRWWLHWLLLALTLVTTTVFGGLFAGDLPTELGQLSLIRLLVDPRFILEGLKFSVPLLVILLCHEMGHYVACRAHGLRATPPFFIPFPWGIGTLGAVIRIKEPIRNKQELLDVGVAGPLAGFVALLPFLVYGIAASRVTTLPVDHGYLLFGEPITFTLVSHLIHPGLGNGSDLMLHPTGMAAWFGLLITALNMLPFAQLDGGHVTYAMFGRWHRWAVWPLLLGLVALGFFWPGWWLWAVIAAVLGVRHPLMWDEDRPLDRRRWILGFLALVVFILAFAPQPVQFVP